MDFNALNLVPSNRERADVRTTQVVLVCLFCFLGDGSEQLAMTARMLSSEDTGLVSSHCRHLVRSQLLGRQRVLCHNGVQS